MSNWIIQRQEEKTISPEAAMLFDAILESESDSDDYAQIRQPTRRKSHFHRMEVDEVPVTLADEQNEALETHMRHMMQNMRRLPGSLNDLRKEIAKKREYPSAESPTNNGATNTTDTRLAARRGYSSPSVFSPLQQYQESPRSATSTIHPETPSMTPGTFRSFFGAISGLRRKKRKPGCTVKISTGYEVTVSKARMYHLKKKWSGLDVMLPKNRKGVLERYEEEYEAMRQEDAERPSQVELTGSSFAKTTRARNYLKKGEGVPLCAQKPPFRPQSAPLFRHVWDQSGEPRLHTDPIHGPPKTQRQPKRPVSSVETAASRSRRLAVKQEQDEKKRLEKQKSTGRFKYFKTLRKQNLSSRNRKNRRIRPATAEPAMGGRGGDGSQSLRGSRSPQNHHSQLHLRPNTAMGMLRSTRSPHRDFNNSLSDISAIEHDGDITLHRVPSRMSERSIAGGLNGSHRFASYITPDQLPDYEVANGGLSLSQILYPQQTEEHQAENVAAQSSQSSARADTVFTHRAELDELEQELESYMSASYDAPLIGNELLQSSLNGSRTKRDLRLLERAARELQQEKDLEAKKMGKALSKEIKKSALGR